MWDIEKDYNEYVEKYKDRLKSFCEISDERNNLLIENQNLKVENKRLTDELIHLAIESVNREKILTKLECEVNLLKELFESKF